MAKRAVSLNITVEATQAQMENECQLRVLCMQKMRDILGSASPIDTFRDNVTIELFDENVDEADELVQDFLTNKEYGL